MPRIRREKSITGIYHIILRGINKKIIFEEERDKEKFIQVLVKYKEIAKYDIYAYCLMDNHVHILIKEGEEPLATTMKRIGVSYVYWYNLKYDRYGHLFQDRYKSEPVEDEKYLLTVLRYIHQNPLKAKIVNNIELYKWSSYLDYLNNGQVIDTTFILKLFGNNIEQAMKQYKTFMNQVEEKECLETTIVKRVNDNQALKLIKEVIKSIEDLNKLDKTSRDQVLRQIKAIEGISIRQISRITGCSLSVVSRA